MQPLAYFAVRRLGASCGRAFVNCESAGMATMGGEGEPCFYQQRPLVSRSLSVHVMRFTPSGGRWSGPLLGGGVSQ